MKYVLITGGFIDESFACNYLKTHSFDKMIVADSGLEFVKKINRMPDIIVGDFDSVHRETLRWFRQNSHTEWIELKPEKSDTDTEHAIREAIRRGATDITILGATGSRLDHVLGNITLLGIGLENHVTMQILDSKNRIRLTDKSISIRKEEQYGTYISLLPWSDSVEGLTLRGFKYELTNHTLTGFNSLGISNEIIGDIATIEFKKGILMIMETLD